MTARLLSQLESKLRTLAMGDADAVELLRLYTLVAQLRKERIEELERQLSTIKQKALKKALTS